MRRSDREVTDVNDIQSIIDKCDVVRIAINDDTYPYIIPVNFGYEFNGGRLTLFFHSSTEGYKHKVIEKNNHASFEMDCSLTLMPPINESVCTASMASLTVCGVQNCLPYLWLLLQVYSTYSFPRHVLLRAVNPEPHSAHFINPE